MLHHKKNVAWAFDFIATNEKTAVCYKRTNCRNISHLLTFSLSHLLPIFRGRHAIIGFKDGGEMRQIREADSIGHL